MRIKTVKISWFRGAADPVSMDLDSKSMVVYGANASGKSSFIDALEYAIKDGSIRHLAHEYSGKRQEKSIPNTHKPKDRKAELSITFSDDSNASIEIKDDGSSKSSGSMVDPILTWDYRRTILRQDEVAEFIHDTKGAKYSALLPLLGLEQMELTAENIRQLTRNVESLSNLAIVRLKLSDATAKRKAAFGTLSDEAVAARIDALHKKYCQDKSATKNCQQQSTELEKALDLLISQTSDDQKLHLTLCTAAALNPKVNIDEIRGANSKLAASVDPLVSEKMTVLQSTEVLLGKLSKQDDVTCPACGQLISYEKLHAHIEAEMNRLKEIRKTLDGRNAALARLSDDVKSLRFALQKQEVKFWRAGLTSSDETMSDRFLYLDRVNPESIRKICTEDHIQAIQANLIPLIEAATSATAQSPAEVKQLLEDKKAVESAEAALTVGALQTQVDTNQNLIQFLRALEQCVRGEIKHRAKSVIADISDDIKDMWKTLHPGEMIQDVQLYLPTDADKAIDIQLNFYGKELNSPRLTLSEGYRNSLGLCIFLAMAKREASSDRPVFLDDVVISLDRDHRGMIVELLRKYFDKRQVAVLTHDREWYTELKQQLPDDEWAFRVLLPYDTPNIGIRWSHKTTTFDDARAQLKDRPDSAANDARKIMDVELALIAQHLQISMLYLRFEKNDRRTAHEFLERLIADGKKCFQKQVGQGFSTHESAILALKEADDLLVSWANRASHTFDVVRPEATKLIDSCERALDSLKCTTCHKDVWFSDAQGPKWVQCKCGEIHWRYGKA